MTKPSSYELVLLVVVGGASVLSGVAPASRAVWFTEMFWAWGLAAILLLTYRRFRFSTAAYSCFFVWSILQIIGAHWTFEHVPMEWLTTPLGLERNPFDRIAHFAVGWFAFPLSELYWRKGYVRSKILAAFFAVMTTVAMAGLWRERRSSVRRATNGTRRRTSSAILSARFVQYRCSCCSTVIHGLRQKRVGTIMKRER